jgi:hypothetical protein
MPAHLSLERAFDIELPCFGRYYLQVVTELCAEIDFKNFNKKYTNPTDVTVNALSYNTYYSYIHIYN